jgi:hypothetical protein
MASRWLPSLAALEIKAARRSTEDTDEVRQLIREVSVANPLWGAPRKRMFAWAASRIS